MADFQRVGAKSNADVGQKFEQKAVAVLAEYGIEVETDFSVDIGVSDVKKTHKFDLGREFPSVLVECKSHRWTTGGNIPSAKLTVWNEAMYYFLCAPSKYRKILFVLRDVRAKNSESLAEYFVRTHRHLIPLGVEIWEFDEDLQEVRQPLQESTKEYRSLS